VVRCLRGTNYLDTMCKRYVAYEVRMGWVLCVNVQICCGTLSTGYELRYVELKVRTCCGTFSGNSLF